MLNLSVRPSKFNLLVFVFLLAACTAPATPAPHTTTPTVVPSATPIPLTVTATCTPSATPVPTVTSTPEPQLPLKPSATVPEGWPSLPADFYFLRDGRLWRWAAPGGEPQALTPSDLPVAAYSLPHNGRRIAYATTANQLYVLDRGTAELLTIPVSASFTLNTGFTLSPDGSRLAYADADGLWILPLPETKPAKMIAHTYVDMQGGDTWHPRAWSLDSRWLLVTGGGYDNFPLYWLDPNTAAVAEVRYPCAPGEIPQGSWGEAGIWFTNAQCGAGGDILLLPVGDNGPLLPETHTAETASGHLYPSGITALSNDHVVFAQTYADPVYPHGLYDLVPNGTPTPILTVAAAECVTDAAGQCLSLQWGTVVWAPGGMAFALGGRYSAAVIGIVSSGAVWDMREHLTGAHAFQWREPFNP